VKPVIEFEPLPETQEDESKDGAGEKDANMLLERIKALSPKTDRRDTGSKDIPIVSTPSVEEDVSPPPKIWPPLGSVKDKSTVMEQIEMEPRPRKGPVASKPSPKDQEPQRMFAWPDSAYEAEARWENQDHYHDSTGTKRQVSTRRRMLNQYVTVKNEPEDRSKHKFFRCVCGTEILLTEEHKRKGLTCPRCGRKLL
jgi:hypothetical protein